MAPIHIVLVEIVIPVPALLLIIVLVITSVNIPAMAQVIVMLIIIARIVIISVKDHQEMLIAKPTIPVLADLAQELQIANLVFIVHLVQGVSADNVALRIIVRIQTLNVQVKNVMVRVTVMLMTDVVTVQPHVQVLVRFIQAVVVEVPAQHPTVL